VRGINHVEKKIATYDVCNNFNLFGFVLSGCTPTTSTPITHQLSTSVVPSGSGSISPSGGLFQDKVTLVATPAQNMNLVVGQAWLQVTPIH